MSKPAQSEVRAPAAFESPELVVETQGGEGERAPTPEEKSPDTSQQMDHPAITRVFTGEKVDPGMPPRPEHTSERSARELIQCIKQRHAELRDTEPSTLAGSLVDPIQAVEFEATRLLRGHCAAIYSCAWSPDSTRLASVGMDNNLIIWKPQTGAKLQVIPVQQPYTMSVKFSPNGELLAYGGLDSHVYLLGPNGKPVQLYGHGGFVSSVGFLGSQYVISGSADKTVRLYDIIKRQEELYQAQHFEAVYGIDTLDRATFATCSGDGFARIFDTRIQKQVQIFSCLRAEANAVKFHPGGQQIAIATAANAALLYDRRTEHLLYKYQPEIQKSYLRQAQELRAISFSHSGRLLFAAGEARVYQFDVLLGTYLGVLGEHETQVTAVETAPDGKCVATCGWDSVLKIWA